MRKSRTDPERRTLYVDEAARLLDISRASAYKFARKGELPGAMRLGDRILVSKVQLERFLNGDRVQQ